jgi:electron transport complex protein RnfB
VSDSAWAVDRIDRALPQTQCTRCGYPDCRAYAQAIVEDRAAINRCPPGGAEGVQRLAVLTGRPGMPLDSECGVEAPRRLAVIDEAWCIGCTLCIDACPVDCIVGAHKRMHTVVDGDCTGCELCLPACPVDCIAMVPVTGQRSGWQAWSAEQAERARQQYRERQARLSRLERAHDARLQARAEEKLANLQHHSQLTEASDLARKRAVIEAALARVRARRAPADKPD